jgi:hypothetical protein
MGALSALSNRETALVLKALGGMNNLVVQAPAQVANRIQGQQSRAQSARSSNTGKASLKPNPANKDPKVLEAKSALKENALAIKRESATLKVDKLPEDHPLIQEREHLNVRIRSFRDLVAMPSPEQSSGKGKIEGGSPSQSEGVPVVLSGQPSSLLA